MENLEILLEKISGLIWGNYLIIVLMGVGIFFTISTGFIQIKGFPLAMKELIKSIRGKNEVKGEGTLSAFQALCTALSSCVGNGNIVGVATAIAGGGPGAVFWMWAAGILGMATKYAEIVIGMIYREKAEERNICGRTDVLSFQRAWLEKNFSNFCCSYVYAGKRRLFDSVKCCGFCGKKYF